MVLSAEMSHCCYGANPRNAECKSLNRDSHTLSDTVVICNQKQYDRMSGSYVTTDVTDYFLMFRDGAVLVCMHDVEKIRDHRCYDPTRNHEYLTVACKRTDLISLDEYVVRVLGSNQVPGTE
jgi:hypothetical protein